MKPFFIKLENGYIICIRKGFDLIFLNSKTNKIIKKISFDNYISFTVTQNDKDKFYVCIYKDLDLPINTIDLEIREYNNNFQIINNYNKKLIISSVNDTLYPYSVSIYDLLVIKNKFYIFINSKAEFKREDYEYNYLINFENNKFIYVLYRDSEEVSKELSYKFLIDENNKLIFGYNINDQDNQSDLKIIDFNNDTRTYDGNTYEDYDEKYYQIKFLSNFLNNNKKEKKLLEKKEENEEENEDVNEDDNEDILEEDFDKEECMEKKQKKVGDKKKEKKPKKIKILNKKRRRTKNNK